jgi:hypothetical protein
MFARLPIACHIQLVMLGQLARRGQRARKAPDESETEL